MRLPAEGQSQKELILILRYRIDTAIAYPNPDSIASAVTFAREHPLALRGAHFSHNLGVRRWDWLNEHGFIPVGEPVEIAGEAAIKATISPDVTT